MVPDDHRIESCLDALYGTLTNPAMWSTAISSMKELTGAESATFALISNNNKHKVVGDAIDDALVASWESYYCYLDPRRRIARSSAVGAWITDDSLLDPCRSPSLEYVNDFARAAGIRWSRGGKIYEGREGFATLALHRPSDMSPFDDRLVLPVLDRLLPHVKRVAKLVFESGKASLDMRTGVAISDFLDLPVGIVNGKCKLIYLNTAGEKLLLDQRWISANNLLQITYSVDQSTVLEAVKKACALRGRVASTVVVRSRFSPRSFLLKIIPLHESGFQSLKEDFLALIVVEGAPRRANTADLQLLFRLTAAEAEFLSLLSSGYTVEKIAQCRGVRMSTARTQMQAIFSKAGVSRQSELMRLLSDFGWVCI